MDVRQVPGVLLSNRPIVSDSPALTDIAPTLLALYGLPQPADMKGKPVLAASGEDSGRSPR
jgi:bisphosphoglycerate-independent phosphoglycerate mutase (AlkP superfamily)